MPRCPSHTTAWSAKIRDSAQNTRSDAPITQKFSTIKEGQEATQTAARCALERNENMSSKSRQNAAGGLEIDDEEDSEEEDVEDLKNKVMPVAQTAIFKIHKSNKLLSLEYFAQGSYHHVWLVTFSTPTHTNVSPSPCDRKLILRIPKRNTLQPYKLRHEVACLEYLAKQKPSIPAPRLYAWDDGTSGSGSDSRFIAEEFIEGQRLSAIWPQLKEEEKSNIIEEIANVIADLGETRFEFIGGLAIDASAGPTIEAAKVFNGRAKFHSSGCYNIGPYSNSKEYIISCYDREIYYYTHANQSDIIQEAFEHTSVAQFLAQLKAERQALLDDDDESQFQTIDAEPLVLTHEDFHAGNMLVRNGHLVGVMDWEFSGVYPLSELFGTSDILQISSPGRNDTTEEEEMQWHDRYLQAFDNVVRQRGWRDENTAIARGKGHKILQKARAIMFPDD